MPKPILEIWQNDGNIVISNTYLYVIPFVISELCMKDFLMTYEFIMCKFNNYTRALTALMYNNVSYSIL